MLAVCDFVLSGHPAFIEVQHRAFARSIVGTEDRDSARDLWFVDLRTHHEKGAALDPFEYRSIVKGRTWDERMRPCRLPRPEQGAERLEGRIGSIRLFA